MYRIFRPGDAAGSTAVGGSPPVAGVMNSGATGTLEVGPEPIDDEGATAGAGESSATPLGRSSVGRAERSGFGLSSSTVVVGPDDVVDVEPACVVVAPAAVLDALEALEAPSSLEQAAAPAHSVTASPRASHLRITASRTSVERAARRRAASRLRASRVHTESTRAGRLDPSLRSVLDQPRRRGDRANMRA